MSIERGPDIRNVGVIGCGYWGKNLVRNFSALGSLRSVCDSDVSALKTIGASFPGVRLTSSVSDLLSDGAIDAVVVATPASQHAGLAIQALRAGKDVFVEKPLALTTSDAEAVVNEADRAGRVLMVGHLLRYHPALLKLKTIIDEGALGKLYYVYSNRLSLGKFRTAENILWSFAPHDISAILYLLGELPEHVSAHGGEYISPGIADVTVTNLAFKSGVRGHIFVSWLHPFKEQKLVVVGDRGMAVFNDTAPHDKLVLMNHGVDWVERTPVPKRQAAEAVFYAPDEPLLAECRHFLECVATRNKPNTDGREGLTVLRILEKCQASLNQNGATQTIDLPEKKYFVHETAVVDEPSEIGGGTKIWHFSHVMKNTRIGENCVLGQNVCAGPNVIMGDRCKIQNNVSIYDGVTLEDEVFCGPSMVFTNVMNPRSGIERKNEFRRTLLQKGVTIGANATIVCGHTIGKYAFVGAGSVVTKDVPDYGLVFGNPARLAGWVCTCGLKLPFSVKAEAESAECEHCYRLFRKEQSGVVEVDRVATVGS